VDPSGLEAEVHTSISRAAGYDNENCRWDFPGSFTAQQRDDAVEQLKQKGVIRVASGERTRAFSVTNDAGGVYEGFFELLAPKNDIGTVVPTEHPNFTSNNSHEEIARLKLDFAEKQLIEAQKQHEIGLIDTLALERAKADRDSAVAELNRDPVELARIKLRFAEMELQVAQRKFQNGVADANELERARLTRDIAAINLREAEAGRAN
jgi:hypothetical protein